MARAHTVVDSETEAVASKALGITFRVLRMSSMVQRFHFTGGSQSEVRVWQVAGAGPHQDLWRLDADRKGLGPELI